jgi:prepilin-type N-terminal cleavage/methylation domain-containing protein
MIRRSMIASRSAGFTLIEVVITLIVVGVLATIGATVMSRGFLAYFIGREIARDDAQGRLAFERMARELRTVRGTADLNIGVANQITITDFGGNAIVYRRNAGTSQLERSQDNGVTFQPLADNVSTLTMTYLRNDGITAEAATPANVYYITVLLTVNTTNVNVTYRSTFKPTAF